MSPIGFLHGVIENNFSKVLSSFVDQHDLGVVVVGGVGLYTRRNPDTVRGVDVAYLSNDRLGRVKSMGYLDVAPELVVEVLAPDDSWSDVNEMLQAYFGMDIKMVWIADPRQREVYVYQSLTDLERFTVGDVLSGGEVLPGFKISVAELFGEV